MEQIRPYRAIHRRKSRKIKLGGLDIGGDAPILVQTMTNSPTDDVAATLAQIERAAEAGADIVRVSCPDTAATKALAEIVKNSPVPIVADIHFHYRRALEAADAGAACLRINPGNIRDLDKVKSVIESARSHDIPLRIGVNGGSLERDLLEKYGEPCPEAMVESAMRQITLLESLDFHNFKISVKASDIFMTLAAYRQLAARCDYPLHLGITEAGGQRTGTIKSSIGIGALLMEGIGDTIRISLSADLVEEVKVGFDILKSLGLRHRGVNIIACPSCARQQFDVIETVKALETRLAHITQPISVSIIGCVVNGPGEAKMTDIGLTGGGNHTHMIYHAGKPDHRIKNQDIVEHIVEQVEAKAATLSS
ncbi:MAG: flavodoxin-dependent (E)-4-hydroxy-3-methylbut-2-enyl-diphosphate synthase [Alphaproteobacteria bacterium]